MSATPSNIYTLQELLATAMWYRNRNLPLDTILFTPVDVFDPAMVALLILVQRRRWERGIREKTDLFLDVLREAQDNEVEKEKKKIQRATEKKATKDEEGQNGKKAKKGKGKKGMGKKSERVEQPTEEADRVLNKAKQLEGGLRDILGDMRTMM